MTNSKTTNRASDARPAALGEFNRLREALATTHHEIPQLLARGRDLERELGLNESEALRTELQGVTTARENSVRRRSATIAAISELESALRAERETLERSRQEYAVQAIQEFMTRYEAAVRALQACWQEGKALTEALRCAVPMALPVTLQTSPVDGVPRLVPILADIEVEADATATELGARVDAVDTAIGLCADIQESREFHARHQELARVRTGQPTRMEGTFEVTKAFTYFGMEFVPGMLLDRSVLNDGHLNRYVSRNIRALTDAAVAAA